MPANATAPVVLGEWGVCSQQGEHQQQQLPPPSSAHPILNCLVKVVKEVDGSKLHVAKYKFSSGTTVGQLLPRVLERMRASSYNSISISISNSFSGEKYPPSEHQSSTSSIDLLQQQPESKSQLKFETIEFPWSVASVELFDTQYHEFIDVGHNDPLVESGRYVVRLRDASVLAAGVSNTSTGTSPSSMPSIRYASDSWSSCGGIIGEEEEEKENGVSLLEKEFSLVSIAGDLLEDGDEATEREMESKRQEPVDDNQHHVDAEDTRAGSISNDEGGASNVPCLVTLPEHGDLWKLLARQVESSDEPEQQLRAMTRIREMLTAESNDDFITSGALNAVVNSLQQKESSQSTQLQHEATEILLNMTSGTSQGIQAVMQAGAVPLLIQLLDRSFSSPQHCSAWTTCENALWVLGHICGDSPHFREECIREGIVHSVLGVLQQHAKPTSLFSAVAWTISKLCRHHNPPLKKEIQKLLLQALAPLLLHPSVTVIKGVLWALANVSSEGVAGINDIIAAGMVPNLVPLLGHAEDAVQMPAMHVIGNIAAGTDFQTQVLLDCGVLAHMPALLAHPNNTIKERAVWILSNVLGGTEEQFQAVATAKPELIPLLIRLLLTGDHKTQKEALWAVSNAVNRGATADVRNMVVHGAVVPLFIKLHTRGEEEGDEESINFALVAIAKFLKKLSKREVCQLNIWMDGVERLQQHANENIRKVALEIHSYCSAILREKYAPMECE